MSLSRCSSLIGPCFAFAILTAGTIEASAQALTLRNLLTNFLQQGISLAPPSVGTDHSAHFNGDDSRQLFAFRQVNGEIARQLSNFPLSSSAGGFAYEFDADLGTFTRPTQSFGPIFTERAFTVGKGKLNVGFNYTHYAFDSLDDLDLANGDLILIFEHEDSNSDGDHTHTYFEGDLVSARMALDIETSVTAFTATFGVSDQLDVGIAIPIVAVELDAVADALVERLATANALPETHVFPNGTNRQSFHQSGSASGVGDVVLRGKYRFLNRPHSMLAGLGEFRLATGDERNLLGTGAGEARASIIGSWSRGAVAPHFNLGYAVAGSDLPNEVLYSFGLDFVADPRITLGAELLGRAQSDVRTVYLQNETYFANTAPSGPPVIVSKDYWSVTSDTDNRNMLSGSFGFKLNLRGNLLLTVNGIVPFTDKGLRDKFAPLAGLDYSF